MLGLGTWDQAIKEKSNIKKVKKKEHINGGWHINLNFYIRFMEL